jgi:rare lipoprotein A
VKVTNVRNGKWIIVRVNDRGPYADMDTRVIDLSYGAAQVLGFKGKGLAKVLIELVPEPEQIASAQVSGS